MVFMFDEIKAFLQTQTLSGFLESHKHPLQVVSKSASVGAALQILQDAQVLSLPVLDEDGEYAGGISVNDILAGLHRCKLRPSGCRRRHAWGRVNMTSSGVAWIGRVAARWDKGADVAPPTNPSRGTTRMRHSTKTGPCMSAFGYQGCVLMKNKCW